MRIISEQDKNLLLEMVRTDFKLRYQGSWLGYMWSLMKPLLLFLILYAVFTRVFRLGDDVEHYPVYLLLGIVIWTYFMEATTRAMTVIVDRGDLIRKISLPKHLLVVSTNVSAAINLFINMILVVVFALYLGVDFGIKALAVLPVLGLLIGMTMLVSVLLSVLYIKVRDTSYIWEVGLQAAFYATPILYPISLIPEKYLLVAFLNPVAHIIQDARWLMITEDSQTAWTVKPESIPLAVGITLLIGFFGVYLFKNNQHTFAEEV